MFDQGVSAPSAAALSLAGLSLFSGCATTANLTLPINGSSKIEDPSGFKLSPPIVEDGVSDNGTRLRLYLDAQYDLTDFAITAHSFNEANIGEIDYFYGRESVGIKPVGMEQEFVVVSEFTQDGYLDTQFGIRDNALPKLLGGYGFEHLIANDENLTFLAFFGHNLLAKDCANPLNLELLQRCDFRYDRAPSYYSELQLVLMVSEHVGIFARVELSDFELGTKTAVFGLTVIF